MKEKELFFTKGIYKRLCLLFFFTFALGIVDSFAQNMITGVITDEQKEPLPGVSVIIQGTTTGTVTDFDGNYSIEAKSGNILVFSYLGMTTQNVSVGSKNKVDVILKDDSQVLTEMVVIGYGSAKKVDLTGSIGSISASDIVRQPSANAAQAMQGKIAGVNIISSDAPGSSPNIVIRGMGTALGGRDPLYIVDGFPADDIKNISPSDIVSMDILKDASSASIYGLRASNGVVIITTKKGQKGKAKIAVDLYAGIKTTLNKVKMANASQYVTFFNENQAMMKKYDPTKPEEYFSLAPADQQPYNTDWYDELLNTGFYNNNTISVSGGGENVDYFLSYNYYNEKGLLEGQAYQRSTIRNNNTYRFFNDRLKISQNLNISFSNDRPKSYGAFNNAYRQSPLVPTRYENGAYGQASASKATGLMWTQPGDGNDGKVNSIANPLLSGARDIEKNKTFSLQGGLEAEFKITDYLKANTRFGAMKYYSKNRKYADKKMEWLNTGAVGRTEEEFLVEKAKAPTSTDYANNSLEFEDSDTYRWTWEAFLSFNKTFSGHSIDAVLGTSREESSIGSRSKLTGYDVPTKSQYWSLNHADKGYAMPVEQHYYTPRTLASYFGRVQYNYNHKYYLSGTVRRDGTSTFKNTGEYWGTFPSFGLGWTITQEDFMENVKFLDYLKFKATWGKLGNQNVPVNVTSFIVKPGSDVGNYVFGDPAGYYQGAVYGTPAKNLTWEVTREMGAGFDFAVLGDRLSGGFEYYDKTNTNAILEVKPVLTSEYDENFYDHGAKITNRGVEFNLAWRDKLANGLTYDVSLNYSYNKNNVTDIKPAYDGMTGGSLVDGQITKRLMRDTPIYGWWLLQADGVWQNQAEIDQARANGEAISGDPRPGYLKYKDMNDDGIIDDRDKEYSGTHIPSSTYGIHFGLEYKNIDFSIDGYGVAGNKIYNGLKYGRIDGGENITEETFKNRWTGEGSTNSHPGATREAVSSTYFLENGSYFRINNITLGYTFNDVLFKGSKIRTYVTAQNPFMFTGYKGFTPEIAGDGTKDSERPDRATGIELSAYPSTRNFLVGVNLQF